MISRWGLHIGGTYGKENNQVGGTYICIDTYRGKCFRLEYTEWLSAFTAFGAVFVVINGYGFLTSRFIEDGVNEE